MAGVVPVGSADPSATLGSLDDKKKKNVAAAHGLQGRLQRLPAPGAGVQKTEGPRAYAPRLKMSSAELEPLNGGQSAQLNRRFQYLTGALKEHGVLAGTGHKRIVIPKDKLTEGDIGHLGFVPVSIAVPEAGQDRFRSYRHPDNNFHIHSHPEGWSMHEDAHAASTMLAKKAQGVVGKTKAFAAGLPHVNEEGLPGLLYYLKGRLGGHKSTAQRVLSEEAPELRQRIEHLRSRTQ